jgi:hypothetical protein
VIAAASTGVARLLKSAPRATIGSASSHFAAQAARQASRATKGLRVAASFGPLRMPHQAVSTTSSVPGRMPPRNMSGIETLPMMP